MTKQLICLRALPLARLRETLSLEHGPCLSEGRVGERAEVPAKDLPSPAPSPVNGGGNTWVLVAIAISFLWSTGPIFAEELSEEPLHTFPSEFDVEKSTPSSEKKEPSLFVKEISKRIGTSQKALAKLEGEGWGRSELIRFALIAEKSKKSWDDLVKQRKNGAYLRDMANESGLEYNELFKKSEQMRDEIVSELGLDKRPKPSTSTTKADEKK